MSRLCLLLEITAVSWSVKITAYVFLGSDCVVQTDVYIFYKPYHFSYKPGHIPYKSSHIYYKPGHISYELVYISMYPYHKTLYISIYDDPELVYMSAEVVRCDIEK